VSLLHLLSTTFLFCQFVVVVLSIDPSIARIHRRSLWHILDDIVDWFLANAAPSDRFLLRFPVLQRSVPRGFCANPTLFASQFR
jgi:hypothetical protein